MPLFFVRCTAPRDILEARIRRRQTDARRVSDADETVLDRQLAEFEPLDEVPPAQRADLATVASPDDLAVRIEALVDGIRSTDR